MTHSTPWQPFFYHQLPIASGLLERFKGVYLIFHRWLWVCQVHPIFLSQGLTSLMGTHHCTHENAIHCRSTVTVVIEIQGIVTPCARHMAKTDHDLVSHLLWWTSWLLHQLSQSPRQFGWSPWLSLSLSLSLSQSLSHSLSLCLSVSLSLSLSLSLTHTHTTLQVSKLVKTSTFPTPWWWSRLSAQPHSQHPKDHDHIVQSCSATSACAAQPFFMWEWEEVLSCWTKLSLDTSAVLLSVDSSS